jgi:hypothetical protein
MEQVVADRVRELSKQSDPGSEAEADAAFAALKTLREL